MALRKETQLFCSKCLCPDGIKISDPPYQKEDIELTYCSVCLDLHHYGPKLDHSYFLKKIKELSSIKEHTQDKDTPNMFCDHTKYLINGFDFGCSECFNLERKTLICKYYLKPIDLKMKINIWKEICSLRSNNSNNKITPKMIMAEIVSEPTPNIKK